MMLLVLYFFPVQFSVTLFNLSYIEIRVMVDFPTCCGKTVFRCVARMPVILTKFLYIFFNSADIPPE